MSGPGRWQFNWFVPVLCGNALWAIHGRTHRAIHNQSGSWFRHRNAAHGTIAFSIAGLAMFVLVLPMAFILDFLGALLVGLCAFWLESTQGIALIYSRLMMLLGGLFLPLDVYPDSVQPFLRALPFAAILHAPGRMLVSPSAHCFSNAWDCRWRVWWSMEPVPSHCTLMRYGACS